MAVTSSVKQSGSLTTLPISKSASTGSRSSFDDGWGSEDWSSTSSKTRIATAGSNPTLSQSRKDPEEEWEDFDVDTTKPAVSSLSTPTNSTSAGAAAKGKMSKLELARLKREESKKKAEEKRASKAQ